MDEMESLDAMPSSWKTGATRRLLFDVCSISPPKDVVLVLEMEERACFLPPLIAAFVDAPMGTKRMKRTRRKLNFLAAGRFISSTPP